MAYTLSWSDDYVLVSLSAEVNARQIMAITGDIASHYKFDDIRKRIYDCRAVKSTDVNLHDIKVHAHIDNAAYMTNPHAHMVFVTNDEEVIAGLALYGERFLHKGWRLSFCESLDEAKIWRPGSQAIAVAKGASSLSSGKSASVL